MKKVHATAARIPQAKLHVSANAFKLIPTTPNHQEQVATDTDEDSEASASKPRKRSHTELHSSSPVTVAPLQKKLKYSKRSRDELRSSSPVANSSRSSPMPQSSLPVAPFKLQNKAKFRKRSHAKIHSSSPVAYSLHSSSPVALGPSQKKAKKGQQLTHPSRKDEPSIPVYREGAEINHKKPKASNYEGIVQALILHAASQYEALVSTQDSFPDTTQRLKWARKSWSDANDDAGHEYEITDEISSLVNLSNLILLILVIHLFF